MFIWMLKAYIIYLIIGALILGHWTWRKSIARYAWRELGVPFVLLWPLFIAILYLDTNEDGLIHMVRKESRKIKKPKQKDRYALTPSPVALHGIKPPTTQPRPPAPPSQRSKSNYCRTCGAPLKKEEK